MIAAACLVLAQAGPATADPTLDQAKERYRQVREQVRRLDHRAERLTEQYNAAREEIKRLGREIREARKRLHEAEVKLAEHEFALGELMVISYKGLNADAMDIVLGADSLSEVTGGLDLKERYDRAVGDAVMGIRDARDEIVRQTYALKAARYEAKEQKQILEEKRRQIKKELRKRRILVAQLGSQVRAGEAADRIGQAKLAVEAAAWIIAERRANRHDPEAVLRATIALEGLEQIGVPYKWGGASPESGFDCSGLITWLWAQHGYAVPHFAASQYRMGPILDPSEELEVGDLVFFHDLGHVGMYIGNDYVLHAPHTGDFVRIAPFSGDWFQQTYVGATRPLPPQLP